MFERFLLKYFVKPGDNVTDKSPNYLFFANMRKNLLQARWRTKEGKAILKNWEASNYSRSILDKNVGKFLSRTDLRGLYIPNTNLSRVDLSHVDLYGANLEKCVLHTTNLKYSHLSEADISGTVFDYADMKGVYMDYAFSDKNTSFKNVNLDRKVIVFLKKGEKF